MARSREITVRVATVCGLCGEAITPEATTEPTIELQIEGRWWRTLDVGATWREIDEPIRPA